ncbi:MAG: hypothetical protein WDZ59_01085 [Pirellulales bacterium]
MEPTGGSTGDPEQDMLGREELIESSLPLVFETYDDAIRAGVVEPVVLLVDCEDQIGQQIAIQWVGEEAVEAAIAAQAGESDTPDTTTALARAVSFRECRREIPASFPYLRGTFAQPPPRGGFVAVVISFGGAATFTVPQDARPEA